MFLGFMLTADMSQHSRKLSTFRRHVGANALRPPASLSEFSHKGEEDTIPVGACAKADGYADTKFEFIR